YLHLLVQPVYRICSGNCSVSCRCRQLTNCLSPAIACHKNAFRLGLAVFARCKVTLTVKVGKVRKPLVVGNLSDCNKQCVNGQHFFTSVTVSQHNTFQCRFALHVGEVYTLVPHYLVVDKDSLLKSAVSHQFVSQCDEMNL